MIDFLSCPACGGTRFRQDRITTYYETCAVSFTPTGEDVDERTEDREFDGQEPFGAYRCEGCGWELLDEDHDPITTPDDIVGAFSRAARHAGTHVREAFQDWLDAGTDTLDLDGEEVGLRWFAERLAGCTDTLPAGYCSDLDLPQGSTYGDAVAHLSQRGGR